MFSSFFVLLGLCGETKNIANTASCPTTTIYWYTLNIFEIMFPVVARVCTSLRVLVNLNKCSTTCEGALVECQLVCIYTTCFGFVLIYRNHLGPLLNFGLPVPTGVGIYLCHPVIDLKFSFCLVALLQSLFISFLFLLSQLYINLFSFVCVIFLFIHSLVFYL